MIVSLTSTKSLLKYMILKPAVCLWTKCPVVLCEFFKEKKLVIYFVFTNTTKYGAGEIFGPKSEENNRR